MAKLAEIVIGAKFGRLTITGEPVKVWNSEKIRFIKSAPVKCDCGKELITRVDSLGVRVLSCGCLNSENAAAKGRANKTHGMSTTGTYKSWAEMWARCTKENHPKYHLYKDRVPPESWRSFEVFFADMGERPDGYSIERVDNDKPYSKDNCVWLPMSEQYKNKNRNHILVFEGEEYLFTDACNKAGINKKTVVTRVWGLGWSIEKALGEGWSWKDTVRGSAAEEGGKSYIRPDRSLDVDL